jgi:hypothetical protein
VPRNTKNGKRKKSLNSPVKGSGSVIKATSSIISYVSAYNNNTNVSIINNNDKKKKMIIFLARQHPG